MDMRRRQPIGVELVKRGVVTEQDIEKALEYQRTHDNMKLGDILHILNVCDAQVLIENIGDILGIKGVLLTANTIKIKLTDYISKSPALVPSNNKLKIKELKGIHKTFILLIK